MDQDGVKISELFLQIGVKIIPYRVRNCCKKICAAPHHCGTAPLNLNLNYEKLQCKVHVFFCDLQIFFRPDESLHT